MNSENLSNLIFTAIDTETSGAYPVGSEIIEYGAIKFNLHGEIARQSFLIKASRPLTAESIAIHHITPEMISQEPLMSARIREIADFLRGTHLLAHHAPFDLGFISFAIEDNGLPALTEDAFCTSLLTRALVPLPEVENHRLQTLAQYFHIPAGQAHRALDDASVCRHLFLQVVERLQKLHPDRPSTLQDLISAQGRRLLWTDYRLQIGLYPWMKSLIEACKLGAHFEIQYQKKTSESETRQIQPLGVVRNPDGDYCSAICSRDGQKKRFYLTKIKDGQILHVK